jgi:hypothetical protein
MTTLESTFGESAPTTQKTSGMAVAALICSLICCLPITTIPGIILGIASAVSIKGNPALKGMGIAVTAIVLGALFTLGQAMIYPFAFKIVKESMALVESGFDDALTLGYSGDIAGFKASFHGNGATVSDAEVVAFLEALDDRYGTFQSCRFDEQAQGQVQPEFGSPIVPFRYVLEFDSGSVDAEGKIAFSDPQQGGFILKLDSITVFDSDLGDLVYPSGAGGAVPEPEPVPEVTVPEDTEPEMTEPEVTEPATTKPDVTEPDTEETAPPPAEPDGGG